MSFIGYTFFYYFLLRFSFLPSSLALLAFVVCGGVVHWLLVLALPFSTLSCMAVFSSSLSCFPIVRRVLSLLGCVAVILFSPLPTMCLGPLLMAALLCILVSCCPLIPVSLALGLPRQRFAVRLAGTASWSPCHHCLPVLGLSLFHASSVASCLVLFYRLIPRRLHFWGFVTG